MQTRITENQSVTAHQHLEIELKKEAWLKVNLIFGLALRCSSRSLARIPSNVLQLKSTSCTHISIPYSP
jgi:hypothetical protein